MSAVHLTAMVVVASPGMDAILTGFEQLRAAGAPGTAAVSTAPHGGVTRVTAAWTVDPDDPGDEPGGGW